jgi:hypothetical protein
LTAAKLLVGDPEHDTGVTVTPLIMNVRIPAVAVPPAPMLIVALLLAIFAEKQR